MMHGLLDCSVSWFLHEDKAKSLPYLLAAQGYDVWVGNNRGNRLSRHEDDACPKYWQYTFDHLVDYDQPALIAGVLATTGSEQVIYVGHSQGSTQFLLGLGVHGQLKEKIACFIGLGRVVSLQNTRNHLVLDALSRLYLLEFYQLIGFRKILVIPKAVSRAVGVLLYNSGLHAGVMMKFIRLLCGSSLRNKIPADLFGVIITHEPGGSSVNNALHWVQCYRQGGVMRRFNYGKRENLERYGREEPPAYGLQHLGELPFAAHLFRGMKDAVMNETDFAGLVGHFHPDRVHTYELHDYNHLDYVWSETAHQDFYGRIIEIAAAHQ
jgi:pimeloyl-ACP methyl ester carboxylesterase